MRIRNRSVPAEGNQLQMCSLIDIVFLLLFFFVMTFKVASLEGDFNLQSAQGASPAIARPENIPVPLIVRLTATPGGDLADIRLNDAPLPDFDALHARVREVIGADTVSGGEAVEVIFDCDYGLRYEHVVAALTAVSGFRDDHGAIVPLARNVRFAPQLRS